MLLKAMDIRLPLKRIIFSFASGIFFGLFLPSTIGGDLVRSIDLSTHTKKMPEVVATVFLDRLSGYVGMVIVAFSAVVFGWSFIQDKAVLTAVGIIITFLIIILLVLFNPFLYSKINKLLNSPRAGKMRELLRNLHQEIHIFRHRKDIIIYNLILSLLVQIIGPLTFYFIGLSLGIKISIIYFFIFVPIISVITMLPISIGGLGLRDATTVLFFAKIGVAKDLAFAMSLLSFLFALIYGSIGGIIYVFTLHYRRIQHSASP
jgi:hypothetical protein